MILVDHPPINKNYIIDCTQYHIVIWTRQSVAAVAFQFSVFSYTQLVVVSFSVTFTSSCVCVCVWIHCCNAPWSTDYLVCVHCPTFIHSHGQATVCALSHHTHYTRKSCWWQLKHAKQSQIIITITTEKHTHLLYTKEKAYHSESKSTYYS